IGGMVEGSVRLAWNEVKANDLSGYKIYWRKTTSPTWDNARFVGKQTKFTLEGIVIDNYLFGIASVDKEGHESVVVFPSGLLR
ncbi:MAG: fibronectin type III domain-containing protein, partial [Psychroflexus sp.]|nr:fibronectin type III domain-containing protein [Psychroflexus sp.]